MVILQNEFQTRLLLNHLLYLQWDIGRIKQLWIAWISPNSLEWKWEWVKQNLSFVSIHATLSSTRVIRMFNNWFYEIITKIPLLLCLVNCNFENTLIDVVIDLPSYRFENRPTGFQDLLKLKLQLVFSQLNSNIYLGRKCKVKTRHIQRLGAKPYHT